ncbi:phosphoribosyltransferase, partial [Candidatus Babeliales bacterium]|nr:phosphoribosyltransferase [Candidatus Babeliales bacterium]
IDAMQIEQDYVDREIEKEKKEAARRLKAYRGKKPNLDLKNKIVLLIDDGVATGATMKVSIKAAKVRGVKEIVVAIPVAPQEFIREIEADVDKVICLKTPKDFFAISTHYKRFEQVEDEEVIRLLDS